MQRRLLAAAALGATAHAALAQSTGALGASQFGVADVDVRAVRNGDTGIYKSDSTDGLSSSRLDFRGNEDLGDALRAASDSRRTSRPTPAPRAPDS